MQTPRQWGLYKLGTLLGLGLVNVSLFFDMIVCVG